MSREQGHVANVLCVLFDHVIDSQRHKVQNIDAEMVADDGVCSEENLSDMFNDENDLQNGYDRNSMMGMLYCIAKALGETNPSFVPILVYLDRICINHENFVISEKNIRRLCIVAVCVSNKMFDDFYIANCCYAELLGISKEHFNELERVFVHLLQYDLNVTSEEYKAYCAHMRDFILDTFGKQKQMAEASMAPQQVPIPNQACN